MAKAQLSALVRQADKIDYEGYEAEYHTTRPGRVILAVDELGLYGEGSTVALHDEEVEIDEDGMVRARLVGEQNRAILTLYVVRPMTVDDL